MTTKEWPLSAFDQSITPGYVRPIYCFQTPTLGRNAQDALSERLKTTMRRTFKIWPFLSGTIGPAHNDGSDNGPLQLQYHDHDSESFALPMDDIFRRKLLSMDEFPFTYEQLLEYGMAPILMDKDILALSPEHPRMGQTCRALTLQVNILPGGGVLLCFAFHHSISDGSSISQYMLEFTKCLAANYTDHPTKAYAYQGLHDQFSTEEPQIQVDLGSLWEFDFQANLQQTTTTNKQLPSRFSNIILVIESDKVASLKATCNSILKEQPESQRMVPWVTSSDCICAVLWLVTMAARKPRLQLTASEETRFITVVNTRTRTYPVIGIGYYGNMFLHTVATARVDDLVDDGDILNAGAIANTAARIRAAVQSIDHLYISQRYFLRSGKTYTKLELSEAWTRKADTKRTGFDFSSWLEIPADLEFDFGHETTIGRAKPDAVRKTWSWAEGTANILPRKGRTGGNADWEISLVLNDEDLASVSKILEKDDWKVKIHCGPEDPFKRGVVTQYL